MKKKFLILLMLLSVLGLLAYVLSSTNLLQGTFTVSPDSKVLSSSGSKVDAPIISLFDTSLIKVTEAGTGATEIDWSASTTQYILGEWTVTIEEEMDINFLYSYIGEPKSTSTSQNNYTQDYFSDTTLTIKASDGEPHTTDVAFPDTDFDYFYTLAKDTYTFTLKGKPITSKENDFNANGFNGNQITLHINKISTADGTSYQQGRDGGEDYFTYDEKVDGNTAFSYGGYTITSKGYVAETDTDADADADADAEAEAEAEADADTDTETDADAEDVETGAVIELSLIEKNSGTNLMSEIDAADLTIYNSANTETPVSASIDEKIISDSSSVSLFPIFSISVPEGEYYIAVAHSGFVANIFGPYTTAIDGYNAVTNEGKLEYAYYIKVQNEAGDAISGATVSANAGYTNCSYLSEGLYACPVTLEQSSAIYSVSAEGYDDFNGEFATLRSADDDASETADVTLATEGSGVTDYMLKFKVQDMYGDAKTGLNELNFSAAIGTSGSEITDISEESAGIYNLYVPTAGDYRVELNLDGYIDYAMDGFAAQTADAPASQDIVLTYGNSVTVLDANESPLTGATVTAGDDLAITCEEKPEAVYACPIPEADTSTEFSVTLSGYKSVTGSFAGDRMEDDPFYYYAIITLEADDIPIEEEETDSDADNDGLSDLLEATYGSNANSFDTDDDGLSDGDEVNIYGTDPTKADTDGDGYNDYSELSTGNDPLIAATSTTTSSSSSSSTTNTQSTTPPASGQRAEILSSSTYRCSDPFTDTNGHWAEDTICRLYKAAIVNGKDYNSFAPDDYITRAEFLKIALLNAGYTEDDANGLSEDYTDVNSNDWFYPYVKIAEHAGVLRNQGGDFHPNDRIKRGDAIVLSVRIARQTLYGYVQSDIPFSDVVTSDYFAYAVIIGSNTQVETPEGEIKSVIGGYADGTFRPNNYISRAEVAAMTIRAYLAWYK